MPINHELIKASSLVETEFEYDKWVNEIPFINFPADWLVKIIPPFAGAIVRFLIKLQGADVPLVSVYLDCYNNLGYSDGPYWEVYPIDNDVARCSMNDITELLSLIEMALVSNSIPDQRKQQDEVNICDMCANQNNEILEE